MDVGFADLLAALTAIGHSMQEAFDPQQFLAEFSGHLQRFVPHDRLMLAYLEEGGAVSVFAEYAVRGSLLHTGHYTIDFDPGGHYAPDDQVFRSVLAGEPMRVSDIQSDPRFARTGDEPPKVRQAGLRSRVAVPLTSAGRIIGALSATSYAPELYTGTHVSAARQVADLIGPFIESIVLLHRERRRRRRLAALTGLACAFGATLNIRDDFDQLVEAVRPHLDFDVTGIALLAVNGRDLEIVRRANDGLDPPLPPRIPLDHLSFFPRVADGETVLVRDIAAEYDPSFPGDRAIMECGSRAALLVPLRSCEQAKGYLFFAKRTPHWYSSCDVEVATGIAAQLVVALQHQELAEGQAQRARVEGRARQLEDRLRALRQQLGDRDGFDRILGRSSVLREALDRAARVAPTETPVLLTGESGTGKELVARAIHSSSPRAEGPYVALNCAALPETLVEAELFGHERGAFTGADKQKPGRFELAGGGTLFLDEVGELPPSAQAKLLRVLQEHEFQRVGGTATLRADVRLLAATNRDLSRAVAAGTFREDLYYRLNVFLVHLPPLRERGDDILLLARHFVRELGGRLGKGDLALTPEAEAVLQAYRWPGNIRELANAVERALILAEGGRLSAAHLGLGGAAEPRPDAARAPAPDPGPAPESLAALERRAILAALEQTQGNKTQAAALLGITRTKLHTRLKRLGMTPGPAV